MNKASYWQRGEALDFVNDTEAVIEANTIIIFGEHVGVAGTDVFPGEMGSLHVTGVFEMPKTADGEVEMGTTVYFDGEGITNTKSDTAALAGYAAQTAAASDRTIFVKLLG